jgi:Mg-chelatase subunit ChlD
MGRLAAGDYASPFLRRRQIDGHEVEITILLDGSSSMQDGDRLWRSTVLAVTIAQAAEQVGVKVEILKFERDRLYSVKGPGERLALPATMARLTTAAFSSDGYTPLSESLAIAAERLAARAPLKRKVLFPITDGGCDLGPLAVHAVAKQCEARGIEVVGVSIDGDVHGCFDHEIRVNQGDDMSAVGLGLLARALEARGRAA